MTSYARGQDAREIGLALLAHRVKFQADRDSLARSLHRRREGQAESGSGGTQGATTDKFATGDFGRGGRIHVVTFVQGSR